MGILNLFKRVFSRFNGHRQKEIEVILSRHGAYIDSLLKEVASLQKVNQYLRGSLSKRIDFLQGVQEGLVALRHRLQQERKTSEFQAAYRERLPLVSVLIPTFNRGPLLVERSLKSVLQQTYTNIEVVIVGDCCTDNTEDLVRKIQDPRIRFENLKIRGPYPRQGRDRWCVAGLNAANRCRDLALGSFLAFHDDDDEMLPHKIETLVSLAQKTGAEVLFHPFKAETSPGVWTVLGEDPEFRIGNVTSVSVFYHRFFGANIPGDVQSYLYGEPGDWNRFRKFLFLGARIVHCPEILAIHYKEFGVYQHPEVPGELYLD